MNVVIVLVVVIAAFEIIRIRMALRFHVESTRKLIEMLEYDITCNQEEIEKLKELLGE